MPKVRASSATIGTMRGPSVGSFSSCASMRTNAIVVDISLPSAFERELRVGAERRDVGTARTSCARAGR